MAVALQRVVTMPQRLADIALEPGPELVPGRWKLKHIARGGGLPMQSSQPAQGRAQPVARSSPMDPIPVAGILQCAVERLGHAVFVAGLNQRCANLRDA